MPQVVVHPRVGQGDGHAPGKGDDDDGRKADQGDEDEQHQEHRHGCDEVVLVQDAELGHVQPIVAEFRGVPVVIVDDAQAVGCQVVPAVIVIAARLRDLQLPRHRVPGVEHLDLRAGAVHDLVEQRVGKGIAGFHVRHVEEHPGLPPVIREAGGNGLVVPVVQHVAAQQHGIAQGFRRGDGQALSGDHVGDQRHVAAGEVVAAALVVQHVGAGARGQVDVLAGEGVPGALGEEGGAGGDLPVFGGVGGAQGPIVLLDADSAVSAQGGGAHLLPGGDVHIILRRQGPHLVLLRPVLIVPPVVLKVHRPGGEAVGGAGAQHGSIKAGEVGAGDEQGHHQHVPHRLAALKFHHRGGNDVPVLVTLPPAVHHRVEQDHVHADQRRQVEHGGEALRGIPVEHSDEERRHQIPRQGADHHQDDAHGAVPPLHLPDGLGLVGLLDDVDDVGAADGPPAQEEQHHHHIGGEGQGQKVGLGIKGQGHLLGVHQKQPEQLPHAPGQRPAQDGPGGAGAQGDHRQLFPNLFLQLAAGGPQCQEYAGLPGLLPEKQPGGVGGEHGAADDCQDEHHHHLLAAVSALRQNGQNGGGAHHTGVGGDQQHGEEAAPRQQGVLALISAAQGRVGVGKVPHGLTPSPCPGWRPAAGPGRRCGPCRPFPGSATPPRPGGSPPGHRRRRRRSRGSP